MEVATPNVKSLTTTNFDKHIKAHDVVLVKVRSVTTSNSSRHLAHRHNDVPRTIANTAVLRAMVWTLQAPCA